MPNLPKKPTDEVILRNSVTRRRSRGAINGALGRDKGFEGRCLPGNALKGRIGAFTGAFQAHCSNGTQIDLRAEKGGEWAFLGEMGEIWGRKGTFAPDRAY